MLETIESKFLEETWLTSKRAEEDISFRPGMVKREIFNLQTCEYTKIEEEKEI